MTEPNIRSGQITAIRDSTRDPECVLVDFDGKFAFRITRLLAAKHHLQVGLTLEAAELAELLAAEEVERATDSALRFLAYRPRSTREVTDRLRHHGYSDQAIDGAIEKLRGWRYLDDREFARFWVENRLEYRPAGSRRLLQELRQKGVEGEVVEETIEAVEVDELPAAIELARKRAERLRGLDPLTRRRRLAGFLQRRGYGWDIVKPAIDQVLGEDDEEAEPRSPDDPPSPRIGT
jgi:regulatory protein